MSEQRLMHHRWRADTDFAALSLGARDLFYGLMGICDSWGCLKLNPVPIRNGVYLGAETLPELSLVADRLTELREARFLRCWEDGDKTYGEMKWFMEEQRIRYRKLRETPVPPWRDDDGSATGKTPATQRNLENAAQQAKRQQRRPAEEKRREEKRREENTLGAPQGIQEDSGGSGEDPDWTKQASEPSCDAAVYGRNLLAEETHHVQKAWDAILDEVSTWGPTYPGTVEALATRARASPEYALAFVLEVDGKDNIRNKWAILRYNLEDKRRCPADINLKRAKLTIRGSPGPRNAVGTISEALKDMEERDE